MQRPDSRASTMSAASQHDVDNRNEQAVFMASGPEAALLQYHNGLDQQSMQYMQHEGQMQQLNMQYAMQHAPQQDIQYMQEMPYAQNVRVTSVPPATADVHDDKRRKGPAVTATNDKELREMLERNQGRPLNEVAQEVIQKERTPMAEKTKQLFAMLW